MYGKQLILTLTKKLKKKYCKFEKAYLINPIIAKYNKCVALIKRNTALYQNLADTMKYIKREM